ncbi:hypothetical protein MYX84_05015 [Acidobacteria bacterium AH-259-O06]|nr:hypothetical protein [Acidobacteria bacterium AH-259-G07]MDA2929297.1 hypothetical protein [Acidobacteria bacterium AH-259-O06]
MKINVRALALTLGLTWAGAILVTGLANLIWPSYGIAFLQVIASVYPGYQAVASLREVVAGTVYGLADGFVGGLIVGWLYNLFAGRN